MNSHGINILQAMGIEVWKRPSPLSNPFETLRSAVAQCTACPLHQTRTQTVFGVGNNEAKLMLIGEAPGFHEDQEGKPFVGRAGQLLNAMLQSIGLHRDQVFIANVLKCRPPNNRDPLPEEVHACLSFLEKQIAFIKPTLLLALGRIAAHSLLNTKTSLTQMRGKMYTFHHIPLIVTYHPAYLLRNPRDKNKAFQDLQFTYQTLNTL
jgi:DNA polymerase